MDQPDNFAPYGAPENVMRILERVRRNGLPTNRRIGRDYLIALGIGDGMLNRTLRSIEFLGFINDNGSPTDRLERFIVASDDEWPAILEEALREAYDPIFRVVDPTTATRSQVLTAFRPMQPNGQWNRMATLFLGLCTAAGMNVHDAPPQRSGKDGPPAPRERAADGRGKARRTAATAPAATPAPPTPVASSAQYRPNAVIHPALAGIVSAIPELETGEDLERWIASFRATFQMVKKV